MKSFMSTWMKVEATWNPEVLREELTPQPNLTRRIPAAVSLRLRSMLLDATSFVLLQLRDPPCLLTEAAQHPQGRRMEPETVFHLGRPLRIQARHCHWGKPHPLFAAPGLLPNCSMAFSPFSNSAQKDVLHINILSIKRRVGLQCRRIFSDRTSQHSRFEGWSLDFKVLGLRDDTSP